MNLSFTYFVKASKMKKVFLFVFCFVIVLFSSCNNVKKDNLVKFFQNDTVVFETLGIRYEYNETDKSFSVLSGDFSGMNVAFANGECVVRFKEFCIDTDPRAFPQLKSFVSLYTAFKDNLDEFAVNDRNEYVLLIDSSRFLVYYDSNVSKITKLVAETENGSFEYTVVNTEDIN